MHLHYIILYYLLFIIYLPWLLEESGVPPRTQRVINQYISLRYPYHTSSQTGNTPHADHWAFHQSGSTATAKSACSSWQRIPWSSHLAWLVVTDHVGAVSPVSSVLLYLSGHMTLNHMIQISRECVLRHPIPSCIAADHEDRNGKKSFINLFWMTLCLEPDWPYLS